MRPYRLLLAFLLAPALALSHSSRAAAGSPAEVFDKRIRPIFDSPNPSSCVQCHLAGVDLKQYILPSHRDTFLSLRDQGLVDLDDPDNSKILHLIDMGKDDRSGAALIHQQARSAEYQAFAAWIKASAADQELRKAPKLKPEQLAKSTRPVEVIRHARKDRLLESFENNIWSMRFRCMSCHTEGTPQNQKLVREHGERVAWFKAAGPEATLDALLKAKLIDVKEPEKSLLLLKPLNAVKHGGGQKIQVGDQGYKAIRSFIEDYARIATEGYKRADELPKPDNRVLRFGSEQWLKLDNTPPGWGDRLLAVELFAWDARTGGWEKEPIATTDRLVWGKGKLWQHTLTLLAAKESERAEGWKKGNPALPKGRYLVKVYVDFDGRLKNDWTAPLGEADFAGEVEVQSDWPAGYGKMTMIDAGRVRK
jgi:hypothetical protein